MKKLIMMVAVAASAFLANAAALDWQYNAAAANVGETVYVLLGSTAQAQWESLAALEAAAVDSGAVTKAGRNYLATGSFLDDAVTKTSADVYYVVVSADQSTYSVTSVADMSSMVYSPADQESTPGSFTGLSSASLASTGLTFGGGGSDPITPPIPEPTSGLLMVVGLAGLALRRRRA